RTVTESMRGVARALPSAMRAGKVLKRLDEACQRRESAAEAAASLARTATCAADGGAETVGDALLAAAALARAAGVEPEAALTAATDRMMGRFAAVEAKMGADWQDLPADLREKYWNSVKLSD